MIKKTPKTTRRMVTLLVAVTAALGSLLGAGTADARWQETPRIGVMGEEIWLVGNNGRCTGAVHAGLQNNPAKPGWVQLTLRSKGFSSNDCKATIKFVYHNTWAPFNHERFIRISGTKKRNTVLAQKRYFIGSGVDLVSVGSASPASKNISYYIAIP